MDLSDSPEEAAFRNELRRWIEANAPGQADVDAQSTEKVARQWSRQLGEAGYAGLSWPEEYGGRGAPPTVEAILAEELARAEVPAGLASPGLGIAGPTIIAHGTEDQKRRYLPKILSSEELWCQGFSEPGAGSDLAAIRTTAKLDGDEFVVDGQKVWSSFAHIADWCILLVRSERSSTRHRGLTYLLVDMRTPGVEVRPIRQITGEAEFNELFFDGVVVPLQNVLGEVGDGWRVAMTTLLHERATHTFGLTGALETTLRKVIALAHRQQLEDDVLRDAIAREWIELQALRLTNQRSLSGLLRTGAPGPEGSIAKLQWSEANQRVTKLAIDLLPPEQQLAGDGRWRELQLRSRGNTIESGSSEILRSIVAERVLGLPRSR